jgi:hypothetical protein
MRHEAEQFPLIVLPDDNTTAPAAAAAAAAATMTADQLRSKMVGIFTEFKPALEKYYDYAQRAASLAEEYHSVRLKEQFPSAVLEERVLICKLDARETPATLDRKLASVDKVGLAVFDRADATYYLFT